MGVRCFVAVLVALASCLYQEMGNAVSEPTHRQQDVGRKTKQQKTTPPGCCWTRANVKREKQQVAGIKQMLDERLHPRQHSHANTPVMVETVDDEQTQAIGAGKNEEIMLPPGLLMASISDLQEKSGCPG